jgi:hypothetical protein
MAFKKTLDTSSSFSIEALRRDNLLKGISDGQ